jgi:hypothetical protein
LASGPNARVNGGELIGYEVTKVEGGLKSNRSVGTPLLQRTGGLMQSRLQTKQFYILNKKLQLFYKTSPTPIKQLKNKEPGNMTISDQKIVAFQCNMAQCSSPTRETCMYTSTTILPQNFEHANVVVIMP